MTDTSTPDAPRDEIEDLLPWYANGRLGSRDRARVEAALAVDTDLTRRLDLIREEMAASVAANEAITTPSTKIFDRVLKGMDEAATRTAPTAAPAEPQVPAPQPAMASVAKAVAATKAGLMERLAGFVEMFSPRSLAFAGLAAVAVVAAQGAALTGLMLERSHPATYQTASEAPAAVGGPVVLVAFVADARIADISAFLKAHEAQIVDGPRANGFYRLRVGGSAKDAAAVAEAMRQDSRIVSFAQPSS